MRSQLVRHAESAQNKAVIVGACDPDPVAATRVQQLLGKQPEDCPVCAPYVSSSRPGSGPRS